MWTEPSVSKHKRRRLIVNVTSLVDVLFILLIFFALSTTFSRFGDMEMNLPKAKTAKPHKQVQTHEIIINNRGEYVLDGNVFTEKNLIRQVRKWSVREKTDPVLLKAEFDVPYGKIVELLDRLRQQGILKIEALTKTES